MDYLDHIQNLTSRQTSEIKKRVSVIRETGIKTVRVIASELSALKDIFDLTGDRNWVRFCQSDALPYGERTCFDYVRAHAWLERVELDDEYLSRLSVRVMGEMGKLQEKAKDLEWAQGCLEDVERVMADGDVVTSDKLGELLAKGKDMSQYKGESKEKKEPSLNKKELNVLVAQLSQDAERLAEERDFWKMRCEYLEAMNHMEKSVYVERERPDDIIMGTRKKARKQLVTTR